MPQMMARFISVKNLKVLKTGTILATIATCLAFLPYFNGAIARVLFPGLTSPDLAVPILVKSVLSPFSASLVLTAVLAAGMSTLSSVMIIISGSFIHDLLERGLRRNLASKQSLVFSKITSLAVGIVSLLIAFKPPGLVLALTAFAWALIASSTLWPLLFGLFWKRTTRIACEVSMGGGFITAFIWLLLKNPLKLHGFIPGIIMGLLLIVIVSYFTPGYPVEFIEKIWSKENN